MARKLRWLAAIALAAATVAGGAGAAQASQTAPAPGWRITATYPEDSGVETIAAASADNAWVEEGCTRPCRTGHDGTTLRHWNGKQWQIVSQFPAHADGSYSIGMLEIAPGAKSNPWAICSYPVKTKTTA